MRYKKTKTLLEKLIKEVLQCSSGLCLDNTEEVNALSDALTVDIMGRFEIAPKKVEDATSVLAKVRW